MTNNEVNKKKNKCEIVQILIMNAETYGCTLALMKTMNPQLQKLPETV